MDAARIALFKSLADGYAPAPALPVESVRTLLHIERQLNDAVSERESQDGVIMSDSERAHFLNLAFHFATYQAANLLRAEVADSSINRLFLSLN